VVEGGVFLGGAGGGLGGWGVGWRGGSAGCGGVGGGELERGCWGGGLGSLPVLDAGGREKKKNLPPHPQNNLIKNLNKNQIQQK